MSNVLKLLSKIVLGKVEPTLAESRVISENQGAFGDNIVGAKELVLLDEVIQGQYKGKLASAWLNVKKVFDSVPRAYMLAILKKLPINAAVPKLIEQIYRSPKYTSRATCREGHNPTRKHSAPKGCLSRRQLITTVVHTSYAITN